MPVLPNAKHEFYVYALIDPRDRQPFYVGKGKGRRRYQHLADWKAGRIVNIRKHEKIGEIVSAGFAPKAIVLFAGLEEGAAFDLERKIIAGLGPEMLTNISEGQQSEREKAIALARDALARLKPYDQWLAERPERSEQSHYYFKVVAEFEQMAAGNFQ